MLEHWLTHHSTVRTSYLPAHPHAQEAQALHDKICAELAAKGAAQAKAAEGSHLSAARAAAQEAAEAEAIIQAARAKLAAAQKAQQQLQEQAAMEKAWAAAETQHAASLTASSEAHRREAVMAAEHVGAMQQQLGQVQTQVSFQRFHEVK